MPRDVVLRGCRQPRPYTESVLENPRSPRVRAVAKLTKRSARQETGLFLLEGPQAAREALTFRPDTLVELYATPTAMERHQDVKDAAEDAGVEIIFTTEAVLDAMADTVTPQGIVAVARQSPTAARDIFAGSPRLVVICEEVRDPGNLGTIIRAADAAGADAVVLTGRTVDPYNPKVVRATTGSLFHVPVAVGAELGETVQRARAAGLRVIAADVGGEDFLAHRGRSQSRPRGCSATRRGASTRMRWPSPTCRCACPSTAPRNRSTSPPPRASACTRAPSRSAPAPDAAHSGPVTDR